MTGDSTVSFEIPGSKCIDKMNRFWNIIFYQPTTGQTFFNEVVDFVVLHRLHTVPVQNHYDNWIREHLNIPPSGELYNQWQKVMLNRSHWPSLILYDPINCTPKTHEYTMLECPHLVFQFLLKLILKSGFHFPKSPSYLFAITVWHVNNDDLWHTQK